MKNKVTLGDKKNKREIITTSFNFDKEKYSEFKNILRKFDSNVTNTFKEFINRVNDCYNSGGGEVAFIIDLKKEKKL